MLKLGALAPEAHSAAGRDPHTWSNFIGRSILKSMGKAERILDEAMGLSEDERIALASKLLDSVGAPDPHEQLTDDEFEEMLLRRASEIETGSVTGVAWSEVQRAARAKLGQ